MITKALRNLKYGAHKNEEQARSKMTLGQPMQ